MFWVRVLAQLLILVPAAGLAEDCATAGKPFGMERRLPWSDSRVSGSPDPPSPYKVVRAFPELKVKQPVCLFPEPGTNRLLVLQHLGFWAGPSRLLAANDEQTAAESEILIEIDGLAVGLAFHPRYEQNGYLYFRWNALSRGSRRMTQVVRDTVDRARPHRIDARSKLVVIAWSSEGHDGGDLAFGNDGICMCHQEMVPRAPMLTSPASRSMICAERCYAATSTIPTRGGITACPAWSRLESSVAQ
jgi:hypothetical protein